MQNFKTYLISILKSVAVKAALSKIFGTLALKAGGFKIWLAKLLLEYGFDKLLIPVINAGIRFGVYANYYVDGKVLIKKVSKAKEEKNVEEYLKHMSNI